MKPIKKFAWYYQPLAKVAKFHQNLVKLIGGQTCLGMTIILFVSREWAN